MLTSDQALQKLKDGNQRYASGVLSVETLLKQQQRAHLVGGQEPLAIILGCSDSRVPAELIFDLGLGDLFVIRIAGNIVAPSQVGSVEFAAERFGTPLVVVLGHSQCGAVKATIEDLTNPPTDPSSNMLSIVNRIRPSVEPLFETELRNDPERLLAAATRSNIRASVGQLSHGSQRLERLVNQGTLRIVGAEYCLESGVVEFFEAP